MRNSKQTNLFLQVYSLPLSLLWHSHHWYIPLVVINATIIHIPVILGSLFCGPKKGAFLGFVFGFTSCLKSTIAGTSLSSLYSHRCLAASFAGTSGIFKSIFIAFVPRILVGVVPYFVYIGIKRFFIREKESLGNNTQCSNVSIPCFGVYAS